VKEMSPVPSRGEHYRAEVRGCSSHTILGLNVKPILGLLKSSAHSLQPPPQCGLCGKRRGTDMVFVLGELMILS
jgi:hypothetical protein